MPFKVALAIVGEAAFFAAVLFGCAGTLRWAAAWGFLVVFFGATSLITIDLARRDPALLDERMKPLIQRVQPLWDRVLIAIVGVLFFGWLALMGLDARFGWSRVPGALQGLGLVGVAAGMALAGRAFRANPFLASVVRVQAERGHAVVSSGPYGVVRHPMYSGVLVLFLATPLALGSWWALVLSGVLAIGIAIRTVLEERTLRRELPGYEEYRRKVRWRLVPGVW